MAEEGTFKVKQKKIFDENYFKISKAEEIKDLKNIIKELEKGNLHLINGNKYSSFFYNMYLENYEIQLDFNIISFSYFKHLYEINKSLNNENNQDEETLFQKTKNEIKELKHILFDKNKEIKEIMENTYMKKFISINICKLLIVGNLIYLFINKNNY